LLATAPISLCNGCALPEGDEPRVVLDLIAGSEVRQRLGENADDLACFLCVGTQAGGIGERQGCYTNTAEFLRDSAGGPIKDEIDQHMGHAAFASRCLCRLDGLLQQSNAALGKA